MSTTLAKKSCRSQLNFFDVVGIPVVVGFLAMFVEFAVASFSAVASFPSVSDLPTVTGVVDTGKSFLPVLFFLFDLATNFCYLEVFTVFLVFTSQNLKPVDLNISAN